MKCTLAGFCSESECEREIGRFQVLAATLSSSATNSPPWLNKLVTHFFFIFNIIFVFSLSIFHSFI
jgi:hypothetical protein